MNREKALFSLTRKRKLVLLEMNKLKKIIKHIFMFFKEEKKIPITSPVDASELLKGKVALITGGSGGIGIAMADSFLKSGAKVIIAGTNEEKLRSCCEKLSGGVLSHT